MGNITCADSDILLTKCINYNLYKLVLLKLAGTVLPRLNEHSGPDGTPIPLFDNTKTKKK